MPNNIKTNKMVSISFRLTEEEKEALVKYSEEHDRSLSWVVRHAVQTLLNRQDIDIDMDI